MTHTCLPLRVLSILLNRNVFPHSSVSGAVPVSVVERPCPVVHVPNQIVACQAISPISPAGDEGLGVPSTPPTVVLPEPQHYPATATRDRLAHRHIAE